MHKIIRNRTSGFTLIELIVVIAIIGILSTVLVANFMQVRYKTRDGVRKSDLQQIRLALETHRVDAGEYPEDIYTHPTNCAGGIAYNGTSYMQETPCDPREETQYYYVRAANRLQYSLYACIENANDAEAVTDNTGRCSVSRGWNNIVFRVINP